MMDFGFWILDFEYRGIFIKKRLFLEKTALPKSIIHHSTFNIALSSRFGEAR